MQPLIPTPDCIKHVHASPPERQLAHPRFRRQFRGRISAPRRRLVSLPRPSVRDDGRYFAGNISLASVCAVAPGVDVQIKFATFSRIKEDLLVPNINSGACYFRLGCQFHEFRHVHLPLSTWHKTGSQPARQASGKNRARRAGAGVGPGSCVTTGQAAEDEAAPGIWQSLNTFAWLE